MNNNELVLGAHDPLKIQLVHLNFHEPYFLQRLLSCELYFHSIFLHVLHSGFVLGSNVRSRYRTHISTSTAIIINQMRAVSLNGLSNGTFSTFIIVISHFYHRKNVHTHTQLATFSRANNKRPYSHSFINLLLVAKFIHLRRKKCNQRTEERSNTIRLVVASATSGSACAIK